MSIALSTGVTGLESYQKMLDIAGNNLANVGTTAFKSSRVTFTQLLSETIKTASQPCEQAQNSLDAHLHYHFNWDRQTQLFIRSFVF